MKNLWYWNTLLGSVIEKNYIFILHVPHQFIYCRRLLHSVPKLVFSLFLNCFLCPSISSVKPSQLPLTVFSIHCHFFYKPIYLMSFFQHGYSTKRSVLQVNHDCNSFKKPSDFIQSWILWYLFHFNSPSIIDLILWLSR